MKVLPSTRATLSVGWARLSIREMRRIAQPPEHSPSLTDRPYRALSIYLSLVLARVGATPNGVTVAWIVIGLVGVVSLLADAWAARVAAALLLELSYLLDFVDGEIARLTDRRSNVGGLLDLLGHGVLKASLPLTVGGAAAMQTGQVGFAVAGAVGAVAIGVGDTLRFYAACTANDLSTGDLGHTVAPGRPSHGRRLGLSRLIGTAFDLSFESPGLYGLTLLAAAADRLDLLALYWAAGGLTWFLRRTLIYTRRLS
jgi:CDP-alcohol phosphatidyltransferase-like enzyme